MFITVVLDVFESSGGGLERCRAERENLPLVRNSYGVALALATALMNTTGSTRLSLCIGRAPGWRLLFCWWREDESSLIEERNRRSYRL